MDDPIDAAMRDQARRWHRHRGRGNPDVEREFEAWLLADERHRRAYQMMDGFWDELGMMAGSSRASAEQLGRAPFYMRRATQLAIGSAAMVALVGALIVGLAGEVLPTVLVSPAVASTYETGLAEVRRFPLAEGSQLILDAGSLVRERQGEMQGYEVVRGRARFDFRPGTRSFFVETAGRNVVGNASTFDVDLLGEVPQIAVIRGAVTLQRSTSAASDTLTLPEGQVIALGSGASRRELHRERTQWVDGMLGFSGDRLDLAITTINRYNRMRILTRGIEPARLRITGSFAAGEPRAFAEAVAETFRLGLRQEGQNLVLVARGR